MDATAQDLIARLRRNPDDADAFAALRAHYQRVGDYASLANLLEGWGGRARDRAAGARAIYEAGELVLGALADRERAVRMYERALTQDPHHQDAFLRLRGLFEDAGEMRRLAELLEKHATALRRANADPRDVALLYHQLGELWEHRFSRVDKAVQHYRSAFELDATLVAAIYAAREIYRAAGNIKAAASLLEKEAKAEVDKGRKLALWRELAHLRSENLSDPEGASVALKRALAEAPGDLEVMSDLARVYLGRAESTEDERVAASDRHRAADLLYQMAQQVPADHALAYLDQALDARADHDGALSLYERVAEDLGQLQRLPRRWVAYLAAAPDRPEAAPRRKQLAQAYLDAGQTDYAITCLEWLLEEGDTEAAERLVDLYRRAGREEDAVRALSVAARGLPPARRVPRLRELLAALRDRGDIAQAGEVASQILEDEPGDPEALHLLEESCRQSGDFLPLREGLLSASRVSGLPATDRMHRLKQVALLSERELDDIEGAISAWRGAAALDPADAEARAALKRLLTAAERWDDLVTLLEREALGLTDPDKKATLYREMARLHRERRGDLEAAIVALRNLRELLPHDVEGRNLLSEVLVQAGAFLEAVPLLRKRIEDSAPDQRVELIRLLATILEERVGDEEGAFDVWAQLLDEAPTDLDALQHMEGIDERAGRHERLLGTLSYRVEVIDEDAKPAVLVRMAHIAEEALADLDRAAELYARALELAPGDADILDRLCNVYERADRFRDLVVLLRDSAQREGDAGRRAELYRRIARTLANQVGTDDGAAEAWREVLVAGEDEEALRFLRRHAVRQDDVEVLQDLLMRLAVLVPDDAERREILLERATILSDRLDRPKDAIAVLRKVVTELAPEHVGALARLAALCELVGDLPGVAEASWKQLEIVDDPGLRVPLARRLADLHEKEAPEIGRAIDALYLWNEADMTDAAPLRRLVPLLESASRWPALIESIDALANLEDSALEVSKLSRRAAEIAYRQLGDIDGAWSRLEPRVRLGDEDAEADLRGLAQGSGRGAALAELFVSMAQETDDPGLQTRRWMDAAVVHETYLGDLVAALEAVLRAFAVDLDDESFLDEADRLTEAGAQWPRLTQVYETLVRKRETPEAKAALLLRHAMLMDARAGDVSAALDQTLRAASLIPEDDSVIALAEERAPRAGRADELLITYDKRKSAAEDDEGRVDALLRAARWSERTLRDRQRTTHYLAQAVALTVRSSELTEAVEGAAAELDAHARDGSLQRAVVEIYAALAEDMEDDPVGGARLLLRASRILSESLQATDDAFAVLKRAAAFAPAEDEVLDELERYAHSLGRLGELDKHLEHLIEEALDSRTASGLLIRRGTLLEEHLNRLDVASEVWSRLSSVTGGDPDARRRLRESLRRAGKHQDLLVALQRDLRKADAEAKLGLLKEVAKVWDETLDNRWEALDAWKKVRDAAPDDAEAIDAITRLEEGRKREPVDSDISIAAPSTDQSLAPEPRELPVTSSVVVHEAQAGESEEFADWTEPASEEVSVPVDSSETMLDDGLYGELHAALASARATAQPATAEPEDAPLRSRETRRLDAAHLRDQPPSAPPPPSSPPSAPPPLPLAVDEPIRPGPPEDFEDDYTAVADDVFDQIRGDFAPAPGGGVEVLGTSEIELIEEGETIDMPSARLEELEEIALESDVVHLEEDSLEAFEDIVPVSDDDHFIAAALDHAELEDLDEIEEINELEEINDASRPPPPPRRD